MSAIIYYFTGTGNSLAIARELQSKITGSELRSIMPAIRSGCLELGKDYTGIVFPVYFFGIPKPLRELMAATDWSVSGFTFVVANYGAMAGNVLNQSSRIIAKAGGRMDSGYLIQMPDNYLPAYDVPKPEVQEKSFGVMRRKVAAIAQDIQHRRPAGVENTKHGFDRLLTPLIYPVADKTGGKDSKYWTTEQCNHCGICIAGCPFENLVSDGGVPQWQHHCEMCMRCIHLCPQKAIQYGKKTQKKGRYINPDIEKSQLIADNGSQKKL